MSLFSDRQSTLSQKQPLILQKKSSAESYLVADNPYVGGNQFIYTDYLSSRRSTTSTNILGEVISQVKSQPLETLDLSGLKCDSFPFNDNEQVDSSAADGKAPIYSHLQKLTMTRNSMKIISSIGQFSHLRVLKLSNNQLTTLPKDIQRLEKLESLDISSNEFVICPRLDSLSSLTYLNLSDNCLTMIDVGIARNTSDPSFTLVARGNTINTFPLSLSRIKSLVRLDLADNSIKSISNELSEMRSLLYLDLSDNKINHLSLSGVKNLEVLKLTRNKISDTLSKDICNMTDLIELHIDHNSLTYLPDNIGYSLKNLQILKASDNKLIKLPASISTHHMPKLQQFDVSNNQLEMLPVQFISDQSREELYLLDISHNLFQWLDHSVLDYFSSHGHDDFNYSNNRFDDLQRNLSSHPQYAIIQLSSVDIDYINPYSCVSCGKLFDRVNTTPYYVTVKMNDTFRIPSGEICCSQECAQRRAVSSNSTHKTAIDLGPTRRYSPVFNDPNEAKIKFLSPSQEINKVAYQDTFPKPISSRNWSQPSDDTRHSSVDQSNSIQTKDPEPKNTSPYYCEICDVEMNSQQTFEAHKQGKKHLKKAHEYETGVGATSYYCEICDVKCTGAENYRDHLGGKTHLQKAYRLGLQQNEPVSVASTSSTGATNAPTFTADRVQQSIPQRSSPIHSLYKCDICNVECSGPESLARHNQGKKHMKALQVVQSMEQAQREMELLIKQRVEEQTKASHYSLFSSGSPVTGIIGDRGSSAFSSAKMDHLYPYQTIGTSSAPTHTTLPPMPKPISLYPPSSFVTQPSTTPSFIQRPTPPPTRSVESIPPPLSNRGPTLFSSTITPQRSSLMQQEDRYYCQICDLKCTGEETYQQHLAGRKHEKKVAELNAASLVQSRDSGHTVVQITHPPHSSGEEFDYSRCIQIVEHLFEKLFRQKPSFKEVSHGPCHKPFFYSQIDIPATASSRPIQIQGSGSTKVDARRDAAKKVIDEFKKDGRIYALVPSRLLFRKQS